MADITTSQSSGERDDYTQVIEVDQYVWNYITNSATFATSVHKIQSACQVTIHNTLGSGGKLVLSCRDQQLLAETVEEVEQLVKSCNETVITVRLPPQENDVKSSILENLSKLNNPTSALTVLDNEILAVIGTKKEVDSTIGILEELYGLATSESGSASDNSAIVSLKLWTIDDPTVVEVDATIWQDRKSVV